MVRIELSKTTPLKGNPLHNLVEFVLYHINLLQTNNIAGLKKLLKLVKNSVYTQLWTIILRTATSFTTSRIFKMTVGELIKALKKIDKDKKITIDGFQYWGEDYYDKYEIIEENMFWIEEKEDRVRLTASLGRD